MLPDQADQSCELAQNVMWKGFVEQVLEAVKRCGRTLRLMYALSADEVLATELFSPNSKERAFLNEKPDVDKNSFKLGKDRRAAFFLERKLDFMKGIDQFLDLRPSGIKIVSMRIHFSLDVDDAFHLNRWIKFAFSSGIEKLDVILFEYLFIDIEKYYIFPFDFLSHVKATRLSSLKSLKLKCLSMRYHPEFDGFKSLTALYLDIVAVSDGDLTESFPDDFPHFTNLKRLKLNQYTSPRYDLLWIIPLLKACPILRDLRLEFRPKDYNSIYTGEVAKLLPSCHLKYLKVIEISGFAGFWSQIDLASRLLKNASVLDIMTINHRAEFERDGKYEIVDCYDNVKHWRRRINRFISKKVPMAPIKPQLSNYRTEKPIVDRSKIFTLDRFLTRRRWPGATDGDSSGRSGVEIRRGEMIYRETVAVVKIGLLRRVVDRSEENRRLHMVKQIETAAKIR
ncbi:hypothetical protein QJS04_geneDACA020787 [Acorus gramineus]|uniref:At1g61320/AtMIF1 LRR domain-containing protein n=1 Tax=Acorus gramineus TaxID=55184 RepID=A0AAV9A617_ACOGR|nr:hypothetical protein QJS04_geneDACA020787 [Acorus gramineus]